MSSVVIASTFQGSQMVQQFLVQKHSFKVNDITQLRDGDTLVIVGHDVELGDGEALLKNLPSVDLSKVKFDILLIVCSAQTLDFTKGIVTPAETIANHFNKPVKAATNTVTAQILNDTIVLNGKYQMVAPGSDVISKMANLSVKDK